MTGFNIYDQKTGQFRFQTGPVMTNVLLADEVNRTIPRTQSSLLESMGEGQVTVDGETSILPRPFFVIATQNPIELEGTFPLPEAQMDRFLMRVSIGYPDHAEELQIMERFRGADPLLALQPVSEPAEIVLLQQARAEIRVSEPVREYIVRLVEETRRSSRLQFGASPRASLGLLKTAQALAAMRGRDYALPDDVKHLFAAVVEHRLILLPEERTRGTRPSEIISRNPQPGPRSGMRPNRLTRIESSTSSIVTLRISQVAAAAALLIGLVAGQRELILLAAFLLAAVNVARLWCRSAARACSFQTSVSRSRLYPGEDLVITVQAQNRKLLPVWVRTVVPDSGASGSLSGDRAADPELRQPLLAGETGLLAFQQVSWQRPVTAIRRGVYELGPVRLEAGDLLGFFREHREEPGRLEVIVYPRLVPLAPLGVPVREFFGLLKARTPVEDPVRYMGTRDYLGGRPARHIHWKTSARLDRLLEKLYEPTAQASVLFLLDAASFRQAGAGPDGLGEEPTAVEAAFEGTLEIVASLAVQLERFRVPLGLAVNGALLGHSHSVLPPGRGPYQLSGILEMLARLTRREDEGGARFTDRGLTVTATTTCLYVCSILTSSQARTIRALQQQFRTPFVVLMAETAGQPEETESIRLAQAAVQRTIEKLAAAGIRTVRIARLALRETNHA